MSTTPTSVVTGAVSDMGPELLAVAGVGLGIGGTILAVRKGWGLVKKFI